MGLTFKRCFHRAASRGGMVAAMVLLALLAAGCNDTCVSFVSNPPQGQGEVHHPCKEDEASGAVNVRISAAACPSCGDAGVQHIYAGVEGVDLQPAHQTGEGAEQWERVAFRSGPVQVDLLARATDSCAEPDIQGMARGGAYRAIRLRLLPNTPGSNAAGLATNACRGAGYHCMVMKDGRVVPLEMEEVLEMTFGLESGEPGWLFVLPEASARAALYFHAEHTALSAGSKERVRMRPALRAMRGEACKP